MKMTRKERKNITMASITYAALRMYALYGFEDATVRQVAKFAQLSTGAIYAHFKSKEGLAENIAQYICKLIKDKYNEIEPSDRNLFNVLKAQSEVFLDFGEIYKKILAHENKSKFIQKITKEVQEFLLDKFKAAINDDRLTANARLFTKKELFDIWFAMLLSVLNADSPHLDWDGRMSLKHKVAYRFISLIFEKSQEIENILNLIENKQYN